MHRARDRALRRSAPHVADLLDCVFIETPYDSDAVVLATDNDILMAELERRCSLRPDV